MNTDMHPAPIPTPHGVKLPGPRSGWSQLPRDLAYLLPGFPIALAAFIVVVTGVTLGVGLTLIWVGVPILAATLAAARGFGHLERHLVTVAERRALPPTYYRPVSGSFPGRLWSMIRDPQHWRDVLHAVVALPVKIFTWTIAITWVSGAAGGLGRILYDWALPDYPQNVELLDLLGIHSRALTIVVYTALGLLFLISMPYVLRWAASLNASVARGLLTNPAAAENAALRARAEQLSLSRAAAVEAEATTLRRVERDIHDGPQQRLVRLTMDLEAAQRRLADNPDAAGPLVEQALTQTQEALAELRALSRGIAPPILADRGLEAALAAAAARSPIPVTLDVTMGGSDRPTPAVENTAYFVVMEALTNAAKHSGATTVSVSVIRVGAMLHVQVGDDGLGGAHVGKGHGLAGLADRLAGVDGTFDVHSPEGAGTIVSADIPVGRDT
ncbi:MAG TPA: sensor domain-containing protein [Jiangellaceae bacterium]|nr:sensor domain-containing protein [Jiangellaceae bacterium]